MTLMVIRLRVYVDLFTQITSFVNVSVQSSVTKTLVRAVIFLKSVKFLYQKKPTCLNT